MCIKPVEVVDQFFIEACIQPVEQQLVFAVETEIVRDRKWVKGQTGDALHHVLLTEAQLEVVSCLHTACYNASAL